MQFGLLQCCAIKLLCHDCSYRTNIIRLFAFARKITFVPLTIIGQITQAQGDSQKTPNASLIAPLNMSRTEYVHIVLDLTALRLVFALLGKYGISVVMTSLYLFTTELYPTQYRHSLLAFSSMVGRIGSITAPLTPVLVRRTFRIKARFASVKHY